MARVEYSEKPTYPIESVDRALSLLLLVSERSAVRIVDAASELGVALSTAHRLMKMLEHHGLVAQKPGAKAYVPGPVLIGMGLAAVRNIDVRALARPHLEALRDAQQETVHLFGFDAGELTCLDSVESLQALRVGGRIGVVIPAFASAAGRVILADLTEEELRALYPASRLPRLYENTITTRAELERLLQDARVDGYAVAHAEAEPGVSAVAAGVPARSGPSRYVVTITIPTTRLTEADVPKLGTAVQACAREISEALPS